MSVHLDVLLSQIKGLNEVIDLDPATGLVFLELDHFLLAGQLLAIGTTDTHVLPPKHWRYYNF